LVVAGEDVERILLLHESKEAVRRGGIKEENDRRRRSLIEGDDDLGSSKSIAPDDGFQRR
jgi:hypothetical protein